MLAGTANARDLYILVLGDQSAGNCHEHVYDAIPGIFLLGIDGRERPATDSSRWGNCDGGSIWMPLAAHLKNQPNVSKIVLTPIIFHDMKVGQWMESPIADKVKTALAAINQRGIKFDYALWQHGLADVGAVDTDYLNQMRTLIKSTTISTKIDKWLIGQFGACRGRRMESINKAHKKLGMQSMRNRFPGPGDVGLESEERGPDCRLSAAGQEQMAQRWFDAIKHADVLSQHSQKESLVYYFK